MLLLWKLVRTDWVVSAPYWFGDPGKTSAPGGDHTTYDLHPPVRPIWSPPVPSDLETGATSWDSLYPGGGAWGIEGPPVARPDFVLIGVKILAAFIVTCPLLLLLHRVFRRPAVPDDA